MNKAQRFLLVVGLLLTMGLTALLLAHDASACK